MITRVEETPKFMEDNTVREFFPSLAKLEATGNEYASEVLDNFVNQEMALYNWMIRAGEALVTQYGERLFVESFGGDDVMRVRMQFGIPGHVTIVHEMSDNNYAAVGVSFKDNIPTALHYNDRTYPVNTSGGFPSLEEVLSQIHERLSQRWNNDENIDWDDYIPFYEGIYPPIVDCRLELSPEDRPRAYAAMLNIRQLVKAHSPYAENILFTSELSERDIRHPDMALRGYNRHSGKYTHTWNFVWRDFAVQWYGRFGRSLCCNRELTAKEYLQLMTEVQIILGRHPWLPDPTPPKPLTAEGTQRIMDKLQRHGRSGAFIPPNEEERRNLAVTFNSRYGQMNSRDPIVDDAQFLNQMRRNKAHKAGLEAAVSHLDTLDFWHGNNGAEYLRSEKVEILNTIESKSDLIDHISRMFKTCDYSEGKRADISQKMLRLYQDAYDAHREQHG